MFYGRVSFSEDVQKSVKKAYGSEIRGFYPSTELCSAGSSVSNNNKFLSISEDQYVLFNDHIIFELLDEDGNHVSEGEVGKAKEL